MSALQTQVGGGHYTRWKIQPIEFWMVNAWDGCAGSALKYICRHDAKNGIEDLKKARHFGELRVELSDRCVYDIRHPGELITMERFISENKIDWPEAVVLMELENWVHAPYQPAKPTFFLELNSLIALRYPYKV